MALAGYEGCEVGSKYPRDPGTLHRYLDNRGLTVCNAWFSCFFTTGEEERTVSEFILHRDFLHAMGAKVIGCSEQGGSIQGKPVSVFGPRPVYTEAQWSLLARGMNRLALLAAESGMRVCMHHHMGTGVQTPAEIDRFLACTDAEVGLLFDTGHIYYSEGTQAAVESVMKKHIDRIAHVHLKDVRPEVLTRVKEGGLSFLDGVRAGAFTVPGDGIIDFDPVFRSLERAGYKGWMVVEADESDGTFTHDESIGSFRVRPGPCRRESADFGKFHEGGRTHIRVDSTCQDCIVIVVIQTLDCGSHRGHSDERVAVLGLDVR
jgi:inosose dehydratase